MKTLLLLAAFAFSVSLQAQIKKVKQVTKVVPKKTTATVTPPSQTVEVKTTTTTTVIDTVPVASPVVFKAYQNYDFVPGDTIVFEDHFADDQLGEFPSHWNLGAGQAVMNKVGGQNALLLTEGNGAHVSPLIKSPRYFSDAFTIEFDWYINNGYGPHLYFYDNSADAKNASNELGQLAFDHGSVNMGVESAGIDLSGSFPPEVGSEEHRNEWHHFAIAYKKNQLKVYVDQSRALVVPNLGIAPHAFDIEGIGDKENPIIFSNLRVAKGAGMNMLGKKFTDAKIVTHGINFDVNKAAIHPESMGTLNSIAQVMKDNPDIKFEVGGHTDSDGDDAFNMALSQARANAVRTQLISMGIDAGRLTTKGYGETKPISDNKTWEGKANNRRVEFVKK